MDYLAITADPAGKPIDRQRQYIQKLLDVKSISTTVTSYATTWKGYDLLVFECMFYSNVMDSVVVPGSYFATTTSSARVFVKDSLHNKYFEVYQDGESGIYVKGGQAADATYGVCIYGLKVH